MPGITCDDGSKDDLPHHVHIFLTHHLGLPAGGYPPADGCEPKWPARSARLNRSTGKQGLAAGERTAR